jgi:hypothetical protein
VNDVTASRPNSHDLAILLLASHLGGMSADDAPLRARMQTVVELKRRVVEETSALGPRDDLAQLFREATAGWGAESRLDLLCALVFVDPFAPFTHSFQHRDLIDGWRRLSRLMHADRVLDGDDVHRVDCVHEVDNVLRVDNVEHEVDIVEAARRRTLVVDLVDGRHTFPSGGTPLFGGLLGLLKGPVALNGLFGTAFFGGTQLAQRLTGVASELGSSSTGGIGILGAHGALLAGSGAALLALDVPPEQLTLELKVLEIRARTAIEADQRGRLAQIGLVLDQLLLDARAKLASEHDLNQPGAPRVVAAEHFVHAVSDLRAWLPTRERPPALSDA